MHRAAQRLRQIEDRRVGRDDGRKLDSHPSRNLRNDREVRILGSEGWWGPGFLRGEDLDEMILINFEIDRKKTKI